MCLIDFDYKFGFPCKNSHAQRASSSKCLSSVRTTLSNVLRVHLLHFSDFVAQRFFK